MKIAAVYAIADFVGQDLKEDYIIPKALDPRVAPAVSRAVAQAAIESGVAQNLSISPNEVAERCRQMMTLDK